MLFHSPSHLILLLSLGHQEKHTPTRDWGSDGIKHARWLIWITDARQIKMVRDSAFVKQKRERGTEGKRRGCDMREKRNIKIERGKERGNENGKRGSRKLRIYINK